MAEKKVIIINVETNIDELTSKLNETNSRLSQLINAEQRDATETNNLRAQKKALKQEINDLNNAVKSNADQVRRSVTNFGGLGNSINQISRELPAFTINMNTGFLAISNNLPILFDEINKVKQANVELAKTGQPTVSVFKSLTSAIFSWGTALSIGVTLLTVYGGKIIEYFTKDNDLREKNKNLISESAKFIAKESTEYIGLINSLKNTNQGSKERKELIEKINSQYGTTLKNIGDEKLFQDQLNNSIKDYLTYQRAKFELKKNEEKITSILQRQSEVQNKLAGAELELQRIQGQGITSGRFAGSYENYNETLKNAEKQVNRYSYANNELNKQLEMLGYNQLTLISQTEGKYLPVKEKEKKKEEEIKDLRNEIRQEEINRLQDKHLEEYAQLAFDAEKRIQEIKDTNASETQKAELILLIKRNLLSDQLQLESEYTQSLKDEEEKRKKNKEESDKKQAESLSKAAGDILQINAKRITDEIKQENELRQKKLQMASNALSILSEATTLFNAKNEKDARAQFKIQKALNLATAITNTALAVTSALATTKEIFPGQRFVEAGLAATAGAVQIAKISQTQFNAGGGGGGGNLSPNAPSGASSGVTAPNLSFTMQGGGSSTAQLLNSVLGQPLKAYVVSSDITSAQMLDAKAIKTSVL